MDGNRFDSIARGVAQVVTRRRVLGLAIGMLAGAGVATADAAEPRRTYCRPVGHKCKRNTECCTGACDLSLKTHRTRRNRCICIPDCDGKVCGSDGCGGTCGDFDGGCEYDYETCTAGACKHACSDVPEDRYCYERLDGSIVVSAEGCTGWDVDNIPCDDDAECMTFHLAPYDNPAYGWAVMCARRQFSNGFLSFSGDLVDGVTIGTCFAYKLPTAVC